MNWDCTFSNDGWRSDDMMEIYRWYGNCTMKGFIYAMQRSVPTKSSTRKCVTGSVMQKRKISGATICSSA